jgi:hypothetical protein
MIIKLNRKKEKNPNHPSLLERKPQNQTKSISLTQNEEVIMRATNKNSPNQDLNRITSNPEKKY